MTSSPDSFATADELTTPHLRSMRAADSIVFRWHSTFATMDVNEVLKHGISETFASTAVTIGMMTTVHRKPFPGAQISEARTVITYARHHPEWQTVLSCLQRGDRLVAHWTVGDTIDALPDEFIGTEFRLMAYSPRKDGSFRVRTFLLDAKVSRLDGADVRFAGPSEYTLTNP